MTVTAKSLNMVFPFGFFTFAAGLNFPASPLSHGHRCMSSVFLQYVQGLFQVGREDLEQSELRPIWFVPGVPNALGISPIMCVWGIPYKGEHVERARETRVGFQERPRTPERLEHIAGKPPGCWVC